MSIIEALALEKYIYNSSITVSYYQNLSKLSDFINLANNKVNKSEPIINKRRQSIPSNSSSYSLPISPEINNLSSQFQF